MNITLGSSYNASYAYDSNTAVRKIPYTTGDASLLVINQNLSAMRTAIAALTDYEKDVRAYYDMRVSRTSGGKRDRLREERTAVTGEALEALALLRGSYADIEAKLRAVATSTQSTFNPATGVLTPPAVQNGKSSFSMASLAIPVGAALAAYLLLKGN